MSAPEIKVRPATEVPFFKERRRNHRYPWTKMEVKESFEFPEDVNLHHAQSVARSASKGGKIFTVEMTDDFKLIGVRIA